MKNAWKKFDRYMAKAVLSLLDGYIDLFSLPLDKSRFRKLFKKMGVELEVPLDEGLNKIAHAKSSLIEALDAIEEVAEKAEENKKEAEAAFSKLMELEKSKASAEEELSEIRKIASSDVDVFRKIGGIPSPKDIKKERYIGFISGVFASIVATGVIWTVGAYLNY